MKDEKKMATAAILTCPTAAILTCSLCRNSVAAIHRRPLICGRIHLCNRVAKLSPYLCIQKPKTTKRWHIHIIKNIASMAVQKAMRIITSIITTTKKATNITTSTTTSTAGV